MIEKSNANKLVETIVDSIEDKKAEDITILDMREIENAVSEFFIICSGGSTTQVSAIASSVERKVRSEVKERPLHSEGSQNSQWILLDYGNVVVHVFLKGIREFYDLESMWGDAKQISA